MSGSRSTAAAGLPAALAVLLLLGIVPAPALSDGSSVRHAPPAASLGGASRGAELRPTGLAPVDWSNLSALEGPGAAAPSAASGVAEAYDEATGSWVVFGGETDSGTVLDQTWLFENAGWRNVTGLGPTPPGRWYAAMTYDANAGGVLLFGGETALGTDLNDTWLFQGGRWTNESFLGPAPGPRSGAALAFDPDPTTNGSLLFGGVAPFGEAFLNDTWVWSPGAGWTNLSGLGAPSARGYPQMAYDPAVRAVVLFSGLTLCGSGLCTPPDTWQFYSGQWWRTVPSPPVPPGRDSGGLAFDPALGGLALVAGYNYTDASDLHDAWTFAAGSWATWTPGGTPLPALDSFGFAAGTLAPPLLVGGYNASLGVALDATWVAEPRLSTSISAGAAGSTSVEAGAVVPFLVDASGGSPPYQVNVSFGDGNGASGGGSSVPFPYAYPSAGNVSVRATVTDLVGIPARAALALKVTDGPSVGIAPERPSADAGVPVGFMAVPGSGSPAPTTIAWDFGDGGPGGANASATHTFATAGRYNVSVAVQDAHHGAATATIGYPVAATPSVSVNLSSAHPRAGLAVGLSAVIQGGTPPFTYSWLFGDGSSSGAAGPTHPYAGAGTFDVQLWVNDSGGGSAHGTASLTVSPAGGPSVGGSGSGPAAPIPGSYWVALGLVVVATAAGAVLLLRRGR